MTLLNTAEADFMTRFAALLKRGTSDMDNVIRSVTETLNDVKTNGDRALINAVCKFDRWKPKNAADLIVGKETIDKAWDDTPIELQRALALAYERIRSFHEKQLPKSWIDFDKNASMLGQKVTPVDRAGLYIPGGKASYPSSLLMNAIPAIVAGVEEIVVCVPAPNNALSAIVLAAAHICGIERLFKVGGASAIGAMAYGTETIPKVNVITGPGNIFVATAKKLVFGEVNIDMVAGPSEIGIIADASANAELIAIDLLSQAEHDEMASSILITNDESVARAANHAVDRLLQQLNRKAIAQQSIDRRGAIIVSKSIDEAIDLMNQIAPEHLEILTANPHALLGQIKHAGAIFLGNYTPEAIGDYVAGPNHTLPTGGTAKFFSPLGVENFMKRSSIIALTAATFNDLAQSCAALANSEELEAHKLSVANRIGL
ncbi:MAG: histidinol dehydrogenase [Helicobacteraceae bacterium]|jgi:histidinol dehydrogenase|nr:histidinol dehydrogenase [Helicobacteraceae bacterium]